MLAFGPGVALQARQQLPLVAFIVTDTGKAAEDRAPVLCSLDSDSSSECSHRQLQTSCRPCDVPTAADAGHCKQAAAHGRSWPRRAAEDSSPILSISSGESSQELLQSSCEPCVAPREHAGCSACWTLQARQQKQLIPLVLADVWTSLLCSSGNISSAESSEKVLQTSYGWP